MLMERSRSTQASSIRERVPASPPRARSFDRLTTALIALPAPWRVLRNRRATAADGPPWVKYIALHPDKGIALVDLVPADPSTAIGPLDEFLARTGFTAFSQGDPPIIAVSLTEREIPELATRIDDAFAQAPECGIRNIDWTEAVIALLDSTPGLLLTKLERPADAPRRLRSVPREELPPPEPERRIPPSSDAQLLPLLIDAPENAHPFLRAPAAGAATLASEMAELRRDAETTATPPAPVPAATAAVVADVSPVADAPPLAAPSRPTAWREKASDEPRDPRLMLGKPEADWRLGYPAPAASRAAASWQSVTLWLVGGLFAACLAAGAIYPHLLPKPQPSMALSLPASPPVAPVPSAASNPPNLPAPASLVPANPPPASAAPELAKPVAAVKKPHHAKRKPPATQMAGPMRLTPPYAQTRTEARSTPALNAASLQQIDRQVLQPVHATPPQAVEVIDGIPYVKGEEPHDLGTLPGAPPPDSNPEPGPYDR